MIGEWQKYTVTLIDREGEVTTWHVTTVTPEAATRAAKREAWAQIGPARLAVLDVIKAEELT